MQLGLGLLLSTLLVAAPAKALHAHTLGPALRRSHAAFSRSSQPASTASLALDGFSGAGGGTGGRGSRGGGGGGGGWDGDDGENIDTHAMLTDAGLHADHVPPDVLAALRAGRIGLPELINWKAVLNSPLARFLASVGYVRDRLIAEPRLLSVLAIELGLGSVCSLTADYVSRPADSRRARRTLHPIHPNCLQLWLCRAVPAPTGKCSPTLAVCHARSHPTQFAPFPATLFPPCLYPPTH